MPLPAAEEAFTQEELVRRPQELLEAIRPASPADDARTLAGLSRWPDLFGMPDEKNAANEAKPENQELRTEAEARVEADAMEEAREQAAEKQKKAVRVFKRA